MNNNNEYLVFVPIRNNQLLIDTTTWTVTKQQQQQQQQQKQETEFENENHQFASPCLVPKIQPKQQPQQENGPLHNQFFLYMDDFLKKNDTTINKKQNTSSFHKDIQQKKQQPIEKEAQSPRRKRCRETQHPSVLEDINSSTNVTVDDNNKNDSNLVHEWGRNNLLIQLYSGCQASNLTNGKQQQPQETTTTKTTGIPTRIRNRICKCNDCRTVASWATRFLPRLFMIVHDDDCNCTNNCTTSNSNNSSPVSVVNNKCIVHLKETKYTKTFVSKKQFGTNNTIFSPRSQQPNNVNIDKDVQSSPSEYWTCHFAPGDILQFHNPITFDHKTIIESRTSLSTLSSDSLEFQLCYVINTRPQICNKGDVQYPTDENDNQSKKTKRQSIQTHPIHDVGDVMENHIAVNTKVEIEKVVHVTNNSTSLSPIDAIQSQTDYVKNISSGEKLRLVNLDASNSNESTDINSTTNDSCIYPNSPDYSFRLLESQENTEMLRYNIATTNIEAFDSHYITFQSIFPIAKESTRMVSNVVDQNDDDTNHSTGNDKRTLCVVQQNQESEQIPLNGLTNTMESNVASKVSDTLKHISTLPLGGSTIQDVLTKDVATQKEQPVNNKSKSSIDITPLPLLNATCEPSSDSEMKFNVCGILDEDRIAGKENRVIVRSSCNAENTAQVTADIEESKPTPKFVLYLLEMGTDMSHMLIHGNAKIEGLKNHVENRGATVLSKFDVNNPPWPTHIVISEKLVPDAVATALGFDNVDKMSSFLGLHNIVCATRKWAARGSRTDKPPIEEPTVLERYLGILPSTSNHQRKEPLVPTSPNRTVSDKYKKLLPTLSQTTKDDVVALKMPPTRNKDLAELFKKLSKLHQECPFLDTDEWRSYSFQLLSGRLRFLEFDVVDQPDVLNRLRAIKGFGSTSMQIITEYLRTGTTVRLKEFELDKRRIAMRTFMNIWGVGRMRSLELLNAGYQTIGTVRNAIKNGLLRLDRNQYIGLLHYEDLLEEMNRNEVEAIADIVFSSVRERYPSAEMTVMGSYRRGKTSCGDVDIMITHPDYPDAVPSRALGQIVDDLKSTGYISYHLTFISGMKHEKFESLPKNIASRLTKASHYGRTNDKRDKETASSWMGIFHSPTIPNKHRRVDIKFYPYQERIYAALYFTGNGHFNRSMRLWATRKFNWKLSDHGLCEATSEGIPVLDHPPEHEYEIFDKLNLIWKEPTERDCFDAVESKTDGVVGVMSVLGNQFSKRDIDQDVTNQVWIK